MTLKVLLTQGQIDDARRVMLDKRISGLDTPMKALMRRFRLARGIAVGDRIKSWDVLSALLFIEQNLSKVDPIADLGCYASEVLLSLHKLGYANLTGIDLNPRLADMPHHDTIHYEVCDFMNTKFADGSFRAITSISVIEHGYRPVALLSEVSRLLMPGGHFLASFDYWPDKIDTTGTKFFDMDWLIFSRHDVEALLELAAGVNLHPVGELDFASRDKVIQCAGKGYTFAMLTLRKSI